MTTPDPSNNTSLPADAQTFYNRFWSGKTHAHALDLERVAAVLGFMRAIGDFRELRICDLGCGAGWSTNLLSAFGRTTGVDLSDVTAARERYPGCEFETADILEWSPPTAEFDVVISMEVLEHIPYARQADYLQVAKKALKPTGLLILTTPNKCTLEAYGAARSWSNQPVEDVLDWPSLKDLLHRAGFEILDHTTVVLGVGSKGTYRLVNSPKVQKLVGAFGLGKAWKWSAAKLGYGLHIIVLAKPRWS
jgi:trans-aconitate methyltransferase